MKRKELAPEHLLFFKALQAFANSTRFSILLILKECGRLRFEEIQEKAKIKWKIILAYHLARLQEASLVKHDKEVVLEGGKKIICSWYSLTTHGYRFLKALLEAGSGF